MRREPRQTRVGFPWPCLANELFSKANSAACRHTSSNCEKAKEQVLNLKIQREEIATQKKGDKISQSKKTKIFPLISFSPKKLNLKQQYSQVVFCFKVKIGIWSGLSIEARNAVPRNPKVFGRRIHMSYFGTTGTPILDFWISKPESGGFFNFFKEIVMYIHSPRSTSGATCCQPLDGQHCAAAI